MTDTSTHSASRQPINLGLPMHSVAAPEDRAPSPALSSASTSAEQVRHKRGIRVRVNSLGAAVMFKNAATTAAPNSDSTTSSQQPSVPAKIKTRNRSATVTNPETLAAQSGHAPASAEPPPLPASRHPLMPARNNSQRNSVFPSTASKDSDLSNVPGPSNGFNRRKFFGRNNSIRSLLGGSNANSSSSSSNLSQSSSGASTAGPADAPHSLGLLRRMGSKSFLNLNQSKAAAANNASSDDLSSTASADSHPSKRFSDSLKGIRLGKSVSKDSSKSRSVSSRSSAEAYAARVMHGDTRKSIDSARSSRSVTSPEPHQPRSSEADSSDPTGHSAHEAEAPLTSAPRRLTGWLYNMVGSDNTPSSIEGGAPLSPVREADALDFAPSSPTPHRHDAGDPSSSSPSQTRATSPRTDVGRSASPPPGNAPTRSKAGTLFQSLANAGSNKAVRATTVATGGDNVTSASAPSSMGNTAPTNTGASSSSAASNNSAGGGNGGGWIPGGAGFDRAFKFFMDPDAGNKDDEGIWLLGVWHGPRQSNKIASSEATALPSMATATKGAEAAQSDAARASSPSPRRSPLDLIHTSLASSSPSYDRASTAATRDESRVGSSISTAATASTSDSLRTKSSATSFNGASHASSAALASDQHSAFQPDFASRIWCTYRNHFAPIARDGTISEQAAAAAENMAAASQDTSAPSTPSAALSSSEAARSSSPPASTGRGWLGRKTTESSVAQEAAIQANAQPLGLGAALGAGYANASSTLGDKMGITNLWSRATAAAQAAGFSRAGLTTDSGWGCMLRTGQSLLANALINVHLGRSWMREAPPARQLEFLQELANLSLDTSAEKQSLLEWRQKRARHSTYIKILSWFLDDPSPACPFGVHRMAREGKRLGKEVGEWFGPSTAAGAIKQLVSEFPDAGLAVELAHDGVFYLDEVRAAAGASRQLGKGRASATGTNGRKGDTALTWHKPVLILIGIRLGLDSVNPIYYESVKATFSFPHSVGIAGGRPSSSYYFMGHQGNSLFYLDPHNVRPAVALRFPPSTFPAAVPRQLDIAHRFAFEEHDDEDEWWSHAYTEAQTSTFHCDKVRRMPIKSLDPSMLLGFLVKDEEDLADLCARIKALSKTIFSFADSAPKWVDDDDFDPSMESFSEPSAGGESEDDADEGKDDQGLADASRAGDEGESLPKASLPPSGAAVPAPFPTGADARSSDKLFRESQQRTAAWLGQGHQPSRSTRTPYANAAGGGGIAFPSLDLLSPQADAHTLQRPPRLDARQVSTSSAATTRPTRRASADQRKSRDLTASHSTAFAGADRRSSSSRSPGKLGADESFSTVHLSDSEVGSGWEEVSDGGTIAPSSSVGAALLRAASPLRSLVLVESSSGECSMEQARDGPVSPVSAVSESDLVSLSLDTPVSEVPREAQHTPLQQNDEPPSTALPRETAAQGPSYVGLTSAHVPLSLPRRRSHSRPSPLEAPQGAQADTPPVPHLPAAHRAGGQGKTSADLDLDGSDDDF
ncbi:related to ATG4-essential for autophagy [Sporisorium reilianum SRZ2]|uniref:Autophagy-related protein 4 n=1 Tax=Sporisorium reilianum (strain SRZ2) TaxID=999809 RepID=E6ZYN1_SPORE|nr:related to ATG4-essential for autophagy [Sporisorium reilianum SRZ2]